MTQEGAPHRDIESLLERHFSGRRLEDLSEFELEKLLRIQKIEEGARRPPSLPSFPEDGLSARQALDSLKFRQAACKYLFPGPVTDSHPLYSALINGYYHATGFRVPVSPDSKTEHIPSNLWNVLRINDANQATSGELTYSGLTFYETKPEPKKTSSAEKECGKWLIEVMKSPRDKVKKALKEEAKKFSGLTGKAFERAHKEAKNKSTTHNSWGGRGPINSGLG